MKEKELEKILKSVANRRRLAILAYLSKKGSANVGEIAEHIKLSFKSTSRHLAVLRGADLVDRDQIGLETFYSLSKDMPEVVKQIMRHI